MPGESEISVKQWILRLIQSYLDKLKYNKDLNFIENCKFKNNVKLGRFNNLKNVFFDENVQIYHFNNIYGVKISKNCQIGSYNEIQKDVTILEGSRIGTHNFICSGISIGRNCFCGSHISFINDRYPKPFNKHYKLEKTILENNVVIGSGATIMCGVTIGENAQIGAGSMVVKNVEQNTIVVGNPAKVLRKHVSTNSQS